MTIIHCASPVVTSCDIIWHHMLSGHYHNSRKVSAWECLAHVNVVRFVFPLFSVLNSMWLILTIMIVLCASLLTVIYVILCILKAHWLHWICCCSLTADNTHSLLHMVSYRIESYLMHVIVCVCVCVGLCLSGSKAVPAVPLQRIDGLVGPIKAIIWTVHVRVSMCLRTKGWNGPKEPRITMWSQTKDCLVLSQCVPNYHDGFYPLAPKP